MQVQRGLKKDCVHTKFVLGIHPIIERFINQLQVREIIGMMKITAVPRTPPYVKGVVNLRGKVIPVIDLRMKFGLESTDTTEETCIIVVEISQANRSINTGIVVDKVQEVLDISSQDIEDPPQFASSIDTTSPSSSSPSWSPPTWPGGFPASTWRSTSPRSTWARSWTQWPRWSQ